MLFRDAMENPSSLLEVVTVTGQLRFFYQLCFLFGTRSSLDFVKIYEILCSILNGFDGPISMRLWKTAATKGNIQGKQTGRAVNNVMMPAKEMTKGHIANVRGFKLMNVVTLMLGYEATKFDRLKDEATILALTSNYSL
uniref:Uncharacterized protein n=1 Tax=Populus trichocarpa TaxID=3694 RepID=A0A2K1R4G1_POPTR